jgi:tRNA modification GTPase
MWQYNDSSTIVALSTPRGFSGIAVVRLSGKKAFSIINQIFISSREIKPHWATFGKLKYKSEILDTAVITYFEAPHSYTGEDIVEISCHGSPYVIDTLIDVCIKEGARLAEPGEFTKRAFLNNKIDLSQAEGVLDLINSQTQAAHKVSVNLLEGKTGHFINSVRQELIDVITLLELELDFSEEEIEFTPRTKIIEMLTNLYENIKNLVGSYSYGKMLREGLIVPIVGPPNSGKSSLLNALLEEERVIVSPYPGTTRDTVEESFQKGGFQFRLIDTAGLRKTKDEIEYLGIERTIGQIARADLILFVIDSTQPNEEFIPFIPEDKKNTIFTINKMDIAINSQITEKERYFRNCKKVVISAKEHTGINKLTDKMVSSAKEKVPTDENIIITCKRHKETLSKAMNSIKRSIRSAKEGHPSEIIVVDLRIALERLDEIIGKSANDDILDNIFSNFCIGK